MRKMPDEAKSEIVDSSHPEAKEAILHFRVKGQLDNKSWLEIELHTGRTHQIRLQCATRGLPIIGDALYGSESDFGPKTNDHRKRWIALHSRRLEFEHPIEHVPVSQVAPLPVCWQPLHKLVLADG